MQYVNYKVNCQIWVFVKETIQVGVVSHFDQQLTLQYGIQFLITVVYAKCSALKRLSLWEDLYNIGYKITMPNGWWRLQCFFEC